MRKLFFVLFIALGINSCIEPFDFDIENPQRPLVIEAYISDVSYSETLQYPSDGRLFDVKLRYGQDLTGYGEPVLGAYVYLESSEGQSWVYDPLVSDKGTYVLLDFDFKAVPGIEYRLVINGPAEEVIESDWLSLPNQPSPMGEVSFKEAEILEADLIRPGEDPVIRSVQGVNVTVDIEEKPVERDDFYMWAYDTHWIIKAYRRDRLDPRYQCWIEGNSYLSQFDITHDIKGGYTQELSFLKVDDNERFSEGMSILVKQFAINEEYYNFLSELQKQYLSGELFAPPPYNLNTNYTSLDADYPVFGYFSIRHEEAKRIYLTRMMFSFFSSNSYRKGCIDAIPPYGENDPCDDCRNYYFGGTASTQMPWWWQE